MRAFCMTSSQPLGRRPSSAFSLVSSTNATESDIPGAGRTLGKFLSVSGRGVELLLSRAAERMGAGPNGAVKRLLKVLWGRHDVQCSRGRGHAGIGREAPAFDVLTDELTRLCSERCPDCNRLYLSDFQESQDIMECIKKLVSFVTCVNSP